SDIIGKRWSTQVSAPLSAPLSGPANVIVTGCFSAAAMLSGSLGVFVVADQDLGLAQVLVRRHLEVVRRGLVLVDAPGQVEQRAVARAIETALPVGFERLGAGLEFVLRRAAEVRADAHDDQQLRLAGAELVLRVLGSQLSLLALALGIRDLVVALLDRI